ncbi:MAG: virulence factor SrfB, partial [Hyphomicrobiaceae bacterium]
MTDAELHIGRAKTEPSTKDTGGNPLVAAVSRLVPHSGIQFIDIRIGTRPLSSTVGKFVEDLDPEDGCVLVPLVDQPDCDGVEWHPVTGERLAPAQTLWVSGYQALEPFLGTWLPLPYLRFAGRDADGEARFDNGPTNWIRVYIEPPVEG